MPSDRAIVCTTVRKEMCRECIAVVFGETIQRGEPLGVLGTCMRCGKRRKCWAADLTVEFTEASNGE